MKHHEVIEVHHLGLDAKRQSLENLQKELNDISAITVEKTFIKTEKAVKFENKLFEYLEMMTWQQICTLFVEPDELPTAFLKAARALCYVIWVFNPEEQEHRTKCNRLSEIK